MKWLALLGSLLTAGCNCTQVRSDLAYRCEADGGCEPGLVCVRAENLCRPPPPTDAGNCLKSCAEAGKDCGLVEDGCGKLLPCGDCAMGKSCGGAGVAHVCGACPNCEDLPDDDALDTNCDGVDGDASRAVFVDAAGGSDANPGTRTAPVKTLSRAQVIGRPQLLVSTGTHAGALVLRGAASIHGGYDPAILRA